MAPQTHLERRHSVSGGVTAGLWGGLALLLFISLVTALQGVNLWVGWKMPALPFLGNEAVQPGFTFGPVLLGLLVHFAIAAFWGLLFGLAFFGFGRGATLAAGVGWGVVVWLVMFYVVLPLAGLAEVARQTPVGLALLEHAVFGLAVGAGFLPFQRAEPKRRSAPRRPATFAR